MGIWASKSVLGVAGFVALAAMLDLSGTSGVAAMDLGADHYAPEPAIKLQNPYKATLTPFVSRDGSPGGFGLFASSGHRTVNLAQPTNWSVNPDASTSGTAVGLGWRARNLSATMGYVRPSSGAGADAFAGNDGVQHFRPRGMLGMGFALHY